MKKENEAVELIVIELEGKDLTVGRTDYVRLKTKDLREYGYDGITEQTVDTALEHVLNDGKTNVIGHFIARDKPRRVNSEKDQAA